MRIQTFRSEFAIELARLREVERATAPIRPQIDLA
jgi:hypothetical protein